MHRIRLSAAIWLALLLIGVSGNGWSQSAGQTDNDQAGQAEAAEPPGGEAKVDPTADPQPDDDDFEADVRDLVDQLDAPQLQRRQTAERELIARGPAALPFLPSESAGRSAEARLRLSRVRLELEKQKAKEAAAAIVIRLDGAATLGEALGAITAASGVEFEVPVDLQKPLQLGTPGPLSFWQALDAVLDAASLDINFYGGDTGTLALIPRADDRPKRLDSGAYTGVYRLEATTVTGRRVLNQPMLSGLMVTVEIAWEPRLTPIGLTLPIDQLRATLDNGASLKPQQAEGQIDVAANSDLAFSEINLPLALPEGRPRKIQSLSGVIRALLPGPKEVFRFPLADGPDTSTTGSVSVQLEEVRQNGPLHEVRMILTLDDADRALESHRQWIFENPAYVIADDQSRAEHLGFQVFRQTPSEVGIGYLFDLGGQPDGYTFHYETPTAVVPSEVTFVLNDILLP